MGLSADSGTIGAMAQMTGKRALLEQLRLDGVRHIFGNPGTTEQGFMDVLQDYPDVQYLLALHEGVAISMADAYARVTRRPAFVEVHIAPGLGNALGMMHNARVGMTPLVIYAGQSASAALLQEPHLSGPLVDMARPICKWAVQVEHAHDVPQAVRRALKVAEEPPQGPVFLSLPIDVLDEPTDAPIIPTSFTRWRNRPDATAVLEAAELLLRARKPMLLLGDGVFASGAQAQAVAVAELLGAPILECYASEFNAPAGHPLYRGSVDFVTPRRLREALAGCDALLAVGAPLFQIIFPEPGRPVLDEATQVVQIDANSWQLGRNSPPAIGLLSDPRGALEDLAEQLRGRQSSAQRAEAEARGTAVAHENDVAREGYWAAARQSWDKTPISGPRLMSEIWDAAPADSLFFTEAVTNGQHLERAIQARAPERLVRVRGGGIGGGLAGALGAQLARPERKVVGICSDGSSMYSITALWTAAHHRLPVTWVILSNASYRILKLNMIEYLGQQVASARQFTAMDLTDPSLRFDRMAEAMGVPAWYVNDPAKLAPTLREAMSTGPSLVHVDMESPLPLPS